MLNGRQIPLSMNTIYLVANGDLRLAANQKCQPAQAEMEKALAEAIAREGYQVRRAHRFDETKQHGFIDSHGHITTLDVPGAASTHAEGINDSREVVGSYTDSSGKEHGFTGKQDYSCG